MYENETAKERQGAQTAYEAWGIETRTPGPPSESSAFSAGWQAGRAHARRSEGARPYGGAARLLGCSHEPACRLVEDCIGRIP